MADKNRERLRRQGGLHLHHTEGYGDTGWILMDCGDVVIHYFLEDRREFYSLERLWGDAPRVEFKGGDLTGSTAPRGDEHVQ